MPIEETGTGKQADTTLMDTIFGDTEDKNHIDFVLPKIDYPDRHLVEGKTYYAPGYIQIGDSILQCPPQKIQIRTVHDTSSMPILRSSTAQLFMSGKCSKFITIDLVFPTLDDILAEEKNVPFFDPETQTETTRDLVHPNTLRALVAQFRRNPLTPIKCLKLIEHNIRSVGMVQLDIETIPDYPESLKVTLVCIPFDHMVYLPSSMNMEDWIIWPIWRWHWRHEFLKSAKLYPSNSWTSNTRYLLANEQLLKDRQYMRTHMDLSKAEAYKITEQDILGYEANTYAHYTDINGAEVDTPNSMITSAIRISLANDFSSLDLLNTDVNSLQFMGGNNASVNITGFCDSESAMKMESMFTAVRRYVRQYHFEIVSGFMGIQNSLLNSLGLFEMIPAEYSFTTMEGHPDQMIYQLNFQQFNKMQASFEQFIRVQDIMKRQWNDSLNNICWSALLHDLKLSKHNSSNTSVPAFITLIQESIPDNIVGKGDLLNSLSYNTSLDRAGAGPFTDAGYIQSAHEAMSVMELYPDLALPSFEYLIKSLNSISNDYLYHVRLHNKYPGDEKPISEDPLVVINKCRSAINYNTSVASNTQQKPKSHAELLVTSLGITEGIIDPGMFYNGGYYVDPDFFMQRLPYNPIARQMFNIAADNQQQYLLDREMNKFVGKIRFPSEMPEGGKEDYGLNSTQMVNLALYNGDEIGKSPVDMYASMGEKYLDIANAIKTFYSGYMFGVENKPVIDRAKSNVNTNRIIGLHVMNSKKYNGNTGWNLVDEYIKDYAGSLYHPSDEKSSRANTQATLDKINEICKAHPIMRPPIAYAAAETMYDWNINEEAHILEFITQFAKNLETMDADKKGWVAEWIKVLRQSPDIEDIFGPDPGDNDMTKNNVVYAFFQTLIEWGDRPGNKVLLPTKIENNYNVTETTMPYQDINIHVNPYIYTGKYKDANDKEKEYVSSAQPRSSYDTATNIMTWEWAQLTDVGAGKIASFCDSSYWYAKIYQKQMVPENVAFNKVTDLSGKDTTETVKTADNVAQNQAQSGNVTNSSVIQSFNHKIGLPDDFPTLSLLAALNRCEHGGHTNWTCHIMTNDPNQKKTIPNFTSYKLGEDFTSNYANDINSYWAFGPLQLLYEHYYEEARYKDGKYTSRFVFPDSGNYYASTFDKLCNDMFNKETISLHNSPSKEIISDVNVYKSGFNNNKQAHVDYMNAILGNPIVYYYADLVLFSDYVPKGSTRPSDIVYDTAIRWNNDSDYATNALTYYTEINNKGLDQYMSPSVQSDFIKAMEAFNGTANGMKYDPTSSSSGSNMIGLPGQEESIPALGQDEIIRNGSPLDYTSSYQHFWGHYTDMLTNGNYGRLLGAFPTYCSIFIDEGMERWYTKFQPIFNRHAGATSISIKRDMYNPIDVCQMEFSNAYRSLSSYVGDQYIANIAFRETFFQRLFLGIPMFDPSGEKKKIANIAYNKRTQDIGAVMIRAGVRLHVRLGYGSNAMTLPIAFNGTVADTSPPGNLFTVIANGDGVELSNKMPVTNDMQSLEPLTFTGWEPRELMCHMLMSCGDSFGGGTSGYLWRYLKNYLAGITRGKWFAKNPLGITHFGRPLYYDVTDIDTTKLSLADRARAYVQNVLKTTNTYFEDVVSAPLDSNSKSNDKDKGVCIPTVHSDILPYDNKKINTWHSICSSIYTTAFGSVGNITPADVAIRTAATTIPVVSFSGNLDVDKYFVPAQVMLGMYCIACIPIIGPPVAFIGGALYCAIAYTATKHILNPTCNQSIGETGENIYSTTGYELPDTRTNPQLGFLHNPAFGLDMFIYDKTPWDIFKLCADSRPNYTIAVRPFEFRSTLFFGQPYYTYRYAYKRIGLDDCLANTKLASSFGLPIFYLSKTFSQSHMAHSSYNLMDNSIRATEDKMCNQLIARWFRNSSSRQDNNMLAETQYVSKRIYPERRKTFIVDTNFVGLEFNWGWLGYLISVIPGGIGFVGLSRYIANKGIEFYYNKDKARMITRSLLRDFVREMYQDGITTTGDASVWPHDKMYLYDDYNDMKGLTLVRNVNIHFSRETGFSNVVELAPYAYVKGDLKLSESIFNSGRLLGTLAEYLAMSKLMQAATWLGMNEIHKAMFKVLGGLSYFGMYRSRTAYFNIMNTVGTRINELSKDAWAASSDLKKFFSMEKNTASAAFLKKEIFSHANSDINVSKFLDVWKADSTADVATDVVNLSAKLDAEAEALALAQKGLKAKLLGPNLAPNAKHIMDLAGRTNLAGITTEAIIQDSRTMLTVLNESRAAGIVTTSIKTGLTERALLGQFMTLMSGEALTGAIVKFALKGPFTMIGWVAGTALAMGNPIGGLILSIVGAVIDAVIVQVLISIPLTIFNRYFDDAYSLDMSLLTHRGMEFSAGINGHSLRPISVNIIDPVDVEAVDINDRYLKQIKDIDEDEIKKETTAQQKIGNEAFGKSLMNLDIKLQQQGSVNLKGYANPCPSGTLSPYKGDDGLDIHAPRGTVVFATKDGFIVYNDAGGHTGNWEGPGNDTGAIRIKHTDGTESWYAHLSDRDITLKPGTFVKAGQVIGKVGTANNVPHLHMSIFYSSGGDEGGFMDPFELANLFK